MLVGVMGNLLQTIRYIVPIVAFGLLLYIWNTTNPATVGPVGILFVFILLYVFWVSLLFIILHVLTVLLDHEAVRSITGNKSGKLLKNHQSYYVASILAFIPVLLLAMQSVNQLTPRDILLVVLFVALAIFYITKRS